MMLLKDAFASVPLALLLLASASRRRSEAVQAQVAKNLAPSGRGREGLLHLAAGRDALPRKHRGFGAGMGGAARVGGRGLTRREVTSLAASYPLLHTVRGNACWERNEVLPRMRWMNSPRIRSGIERCQGLPDAQEVSSVGAQGMPRHGGVGKPRQGGTRRRLRYVSFLGARGRMKMKVHVTWWVGYVHLDFIAAKNDGALLHKTF